MQNDTNSAIKFNLVSAAVTVEAVVAVVAAVAAAKARASLKNKDSFFILKEKKSESNFFA